MLSKSKDASFPSYEYDGPFCELSQKIWVEQHHDLQLLLVEIIGIEMKILISELHGAVYLKEMDVDTFLGVAREIEKLYRSIWDIKWLVV